MREYVGFLAHEQNQRAELAATLSGLELPNFLALLDLVQRMGDAGLTIELATELHRLLQWRGRERLLDRIGQIRDTAARALGEGWNHARFEAAASEIEQHFEMGRLREAVEGARHLVDRARNAGDQAYGAAGYDLAISLVLLGRMLQVAGGAEPALPLLEEARHRFESIAASAENQAASRMASVCLAEKARCLIVLGRLDEAASACEENIRRAEQLDDERQVAVGKSQVAAVRLRQRRHAEALVAYAEARERFARLNEPSNVAVAWHQIGCAYQEAGQPQAAEDAYRESLTIKVRLNDTIGQAGTLSQLGSLYDDALGRPDEAARYYRQAADTYVAGGDLAGEGGVRNNLAATLRRLHLLGEARREIRRAIECNAQFGHAVQPWKSWAILAAIESDSGDGTAADEAKAKAIASYLAYRREGGENHSGAGRLGQAVTQSLRANDPAAAKALLYQFANPDAGRLRPFVEALQAIVAGSRDRRLADAPDLRYEMAAEILFTIETLENPP